MKAFKLFSILAVSSILLFSSCTKDYECQCCGGRFGGCVDLPTIENKSKRVAKQECEQNSNPSIVADGYTCELK